MKLASYKKILAAVMAISVTTVSEISVPVMATDIEAAEDEVSLEDEASVENEVSMDEELDMEDGEMSVIDETENPDLKSEEQNSDVDELEITSDEEGTQETLSEEIQEDMFSAGTAEEAAQSAVRSTVYKLGTKVTALWQQDDGIIEYSYTPAKTGYYQIQGESDRIYDTEIFEGAEKIIDYKYEDKEYTWNLDEDDMIKVFLKKGQKYTIRFIVPGEDHIFEEDEYLRFSMRLQKETLGGIVAGDSWYLDNKGTLNIWRDVDIEGHNAEFIQWKNLLKKKNMVKKLIVEEGVESVDANCEDFGELATVDFPSTINVIIVNFSGCTKLKNINIPSDANISYVGGGFSDVPWYMSQGEYKVVGGVLFDYPIKSELIIPEIVRHISWNTMLYKEGIKKVKKITLPGSIKEIDMNTFLGWNLEEVVIKEGVKILGRCSFLNCNKLKQITIPKSVEKIDEYAIGYQHEDRFSSEWIDGCTRNTADYLPTINCYTNSAAHKYAVKNGIPFRLLDAAKKTVTVKFNANGGKVSKTSVKVTSGKKYGSLPKATRSGYTFLGWYTAKSGGTLVTKNSYVNNTKTHTLYARWKSTKVTVTFNANGGKVTKTSSIVTKGKKYGTLPKATRNGYSFQGWYTAKTGGKKVTESTTVNVYGKQTLYARWKSTKVTVTFNANGGKVTKTSATVTKGRKYGTLPKATKKGYKFQGWYTAKTGGKKVTAATIVNVYGKQTLYARWKK